VAPAAGAGVGSRKHNRAQQQSAAAKEVINNDGFLCSDGEEVINNDSFFCFYANDRPTAGQGRKKNKTKGGCGLEREPYGYYHGDEASQYTFYRLPKALFTDGRYGGLSYGAKILYGLMLDRMGLSAKNGWIDGENRVYIVFTLDEVQGWMGCAREKAAKMLAELDTERGIGLIERIRRGQGLPAITYVRKFFDDGGAPKGASRARGKRTPGGPKNEPPEVRKSNFKEFGNRTPKSSEIELQGVRKPNSIPYLRKTDMNETMSSSINQSHQPTGAARGETPTDGLTDGPIDESTDGSAEEHAGAVRALIDYEDIRHDGYERMDIIDGIVDVMAEALATTRPTIRVGGEDRPAGEVKRRLLGVNRSHVEYAIGRMRGGAREISNIRAYALTALYNAPTTMSLYYQARAGLDERKESESERRKE
jgi:hypothetical protein